MSLIDEINGTPSACPFCKLEDADVEVVSSPSWVGDEIEAAFHCKTCGKAWQEFYALADAKEWENYEEEYE